MQRSVPASHGRPAGGEEVVLILSRKVNEAIVLTDAETGEQIAEVMVTDIRRADSGRPYCKLGITAPQAVAVRRNELPDIRIFTEESDGTDRTAQG